MSKTVPATLLGVAILATLKSGSKNELSDEFYKNIRLLGMIDAYKYQEEDVFMMEFDDGRCSVALRIVPKIMSTYYLSSIKVIGDQSCYRKGYSNEVLRVICNAADIAKVNLLIFPAPFGDVSNGPDVKKLKQWYSSWGFEPLSEDSDNSIFMVRKKR